MTPMSGDTGPAGAVSGEAAAIPGLLVVAPDTPGERSVPVYDWLVVGRECAGADDRRRVLIDDPAISRTHLELWLDHERDQAWLTDRSTNGTRINGQRMERSTPVQVQPGDRVRLGRVELQFRSRRFTTVAAEGLPETVLEIAVADMVMVVGDILSFSAIAEYTEDRVLLHNIDRLYAELRQVLFRRHGTLSNYVGDAFFATWETAATPDAVTSAVAFALEAAEEVARVAPGLELRDPAGQAGADGLGGGLRAGGRQPADRDARLGARRHDERGVPAVGDRRPGRPAGRAGHRCRAPGGRDGVHLHPAVGRPAQGPQPGRAGARRRPALRPGPRPSAPPSPPAGAGPSPGRPAARGS